MSTLRAVLFDLDGVLVKSEDAWFHVLEEAGRHFRGSPVTREEFAPTFGQGTAADAEVFRLGCTAEDLNRFYLEHFPTFTRHVWVNPEARGLLDTLAAMEVKAVVVTNTVTPLASQLLEAGHLLDGFAAVVGADQVEHSKPAPDLLVRALGLLALEPAQALMVGDSRYDRGAAQAAGVPFVGLGIDGDWRIEQLGALVMLPPLGYSG